MKILVATLTDGIHFHVRLRTDADEWTFAMFKDLQGAEACAEMLSRCTRSEALRLDNLARKVRNAVYNEHAPVD